MDISKFYNNYGWKKNLKVFKDAELFEDLRENSKEYISKCRMRVNKYIPKKGENLSLEDIRSIIIEESKEVYKTRESLLTEEIMRGFEKFVVLRTIDEKWKDHLYAMDQLREGINLRAYGQKNPLLEYKSEGFQMFQQMMSDSNEASIQRLFRTQIQGVDINSQQPNSSSVRNVQVNHEESTGMGFSGPSMQEQASNSSNMPIEPIKSVDKKGRNDKIGLISPSGKRIEVKYKKLPTYLNQGYKEE